MSTVTVTHHRFPSHSTTLATLTNAYDVQGTVELSDTGMGSITLPLDDPNDIRINDLIRFTIGETVVHAFIVEEIQEHTLDDDEDHAHTRVISGRGVAAVLDWVIVGPANGFGAQPKEQDRLFNVYAPQYPLTGLDDAVLTGNPSIPAEWPLNDWGTHGPWISTTSATETSTPAGPSLLFSNVTLDDPVSATVLLAADNWADLYIDGQMILKAGGPAEDHSYKRTYTARIELSAGTHRIAVRMFNKGSDNHGGIRFILATTSDNGDIIDFLHESSDSWVNVETPSPWPGMTPGQAVDIPFTEGHDRDRIGFVGADFTHTHDSAGTTWPTVGDISTKTGNSLLAFLVELAATYVDWVMDPGSLTLSMYVKDGYAQIGGDAVTLEPAAVTAADGNVVQLDRVIT